MEKNLLGSINWGVPSWDLFIFIFFAAFAVLYGLTLGRARILTVLISTYVALAAVSNLPYLTQETAARFGLGPVFVLKLIVFGVILVLSFLLICRMGSFLDTGGIAHLPHVLLFSILQAGLLISIVISFVLPQATVNLAPLTRLVFVSDMARFLWIIAPIVAMFLVKREEPPA